ncbi:uncharacterized protein RCC_05994 [Ramularia collo-cygni]|uniref:Uncharacterized protein n=1 Tax=Ramularia collo-cygni TaxID=112498 RepID=A0A2D3V603_9PEZI|nr:uncharacterized protein RCC_05994 [Ramularia collo-cygni]CZT20137.1 uncharacterized protein RCC_05994 [Ramularia collo-cygni]
MDDEHRDLSTAGLQSAKPTKAQKAELELERIQAMDFASRENSLLKRTSGTKRKSVRFSTTIGRHRSTSPVAFSVPSIVTGNQNVDSTHNSNRSQPADQLQHGELLMPVRYSPPSGSESENSTISNDSWDSIQHDAKRSDVQYALPEGNVTAISKMADLTVDTDSHRGHTRNTSSFSKRGRRDSHQFDIYFTPTDYTRSQIFLSSPVASPELPPEKAEDECLTPKASMSRPPSAIFFGSDSTPSLRDEVKREKLSITPGQHDQLIIALAKSQLIQRHVRKQWWNSDDIPEDESTFSASLTSLTASNTVSTTHSRPNGNYLADHRSRHPQDHPYAKRPLPSPPVPFGGIALLDSRIHGSPVRYTSGDYRQGSQVVGIGSCTFLNLPYGTDVECTLRIEPASPFNDNCKVMLQAANQVVDRKTSKRAYLLAADVDVTDLFAKAALTELAEATGMTYDDIIIQKPPPVSSSEDTNSIDWCALADEMQNTADSVHLIDTAVQAFATLKPENCAMRTLALMSELERIKDQHVDFLIIVPTKFHDNGMPSNMRMPWVSQRLYNDWYGGKDGPGFTQTARAFQEGIVGHVARRAIGRKKFTVAVGWKGEDQVVHCVPLRAKGEGEGAAWVCFLRGEFDLQP